MHKSNVRTIITALYIIPILKGSIQLFNYM